MTLSVLGYFSRQFDGTFADVANSAKSLAHWTVTFPAIATASCEQKGQSSYSLPTPAYLSLRLGAHHAPKTCHGTSVVVQKYDIHQPSHRTDWLTGSRVVTVMSRRVVLDAYLAFATEVNQAIELADDPEDLDWQRIIKATVVEPLPIYCYAGVQEWIVEGIRIAYAKYIIAHWHRRTAWKFLKGSIQSSLRKYSREGVLSFGAVCWTEARGNSVYIAASTTWRVLKHPWTHRQMYQDPLVDTRDKVLDFCRFTACEGACMLVRIVLSGIGCGIGAGLGLKLWLSCGGQGGVERWRPEGGKDRSISTAIFVCWALGYNITDALVAAMLRPHVEVFLGLAPPFDSQDEDDGEPQVD